MSDPLIKQAALLLGLALGVGPAIAEDAALAKADALRTPISQGEVKAVVILKAGDLAAAPIPYDVRISPEGARIVTATGGDRKGQRMLARDDGFWTLVQGGGHPVRLPHLQRMIGPAAFADIGRIRFARDYDVVKTTPGEDGVRVYRLKAKSEDAIFQDIELTLGSDGAPTQMVLLYPSGKVMREVTFASPASSAQGPYVPQMTIFDPIDPSRRAVIESFDFVEKPEAAADFQPADFGGKS